MKINEKTKITHILKESKGVSGVLDKYGLYCAKCRGAAEDTIEKVAINNGLDVKKFLEEIISAMDK